MKLYAIQLRGTRDFLHSALKVEAALPQSGPKKKPTRDDVANAWKALVHYDQVLAAPILPDGAVERMLWDAAPLLGPKIGKLNFRMLIKSGLFVLDNKPVPFKGIRGGIENLPKRSGCYVHWACYRNRITGGVGVATRLAVRAPWDVEFSLEAIHPEFSLDVIAKLFEAGGSFIGLGAWRPRFGRFKLVNCEEIGQAAKAV